MGVIAVGVGVMVPKAMAANKDCGCNVALLQGSFSYAAQALTLAGPVTPPDTFNLIGVYTPVAFAGTVSFDGKGNLHGVDVINFGWGGIPRTYTGTYAVVDATAKPKDCAFIATFTDSIGDPPSDLYIVLASEGTIVELVSTDPNLILTVRADKK